MKSFEFKILPIGLNEYQFALFEGGTLNVMDDLPIWARKFKKLSVLRRNVVNASKAFDLKGYTLKNKCVKLGWVAHIVSEDKSNEILHMAHNLNS